MSGVPWNCGTGGRAISTGRVGRSGEEKIKTFFQEARIPLWERRHWPVLTDGDSIVWSRRFGPARGWRRGRAAALSWRSGRSGCESVSPARNNRESGMVLGGVYRVSAGYGGFVNSNIKTLVFWVGTDMRGGAAVRGGAQRPGAERRPDHQLHRFHEQGEGTAGQGRHHHRQRGARRLYRNPNRLPHLRFPPTIPTSTTCFATRGVNVNIKDTQLRRAGSPCW